MQVGAGAVAGTPARRNPGVANAMAMAMEELPYLTPRQAETLTWICCFWSRHRHGPTQREIARALAASGRTATAVPFVRPLIRKGYLRRTQATSRNLQPTRLATAKLELEGRMTDHST